MHRINNRNDLSECSELQNPERNQSLLKRTCCNPREADGFTVISICFFVLTVAVTCSLIIQINFGSSEVTPHGAVASDSQLCSEVGVNFMRKEGTAVDALVASLLCLSVTHPHVVGPGGGGVILIRNHRLNYSSIFDFMVEIPRGGKVGVPGFLKGLEKVHSLFGKLPWQTLFKPAITLASDGFNVSRELSKALSEVTGARFSSNFKTEFYPKGLAPMPGHILTRKKFAKFLEDVSVGGANELHLMRYGVEMIEAFQSLHSNLTVHDFHQYEVKEREPLTGEVNNVTLITAGPPFGGLQTLSALKLMKELGVTSYTGPNKLYMAFTKGLHRGATISASIAASDDYNLTDVATLLSEVTSRNFTYEDVPSEASGMPASEVSVIDTFDLYAAAVVGLGDTFGSGYMTKHGIIVNGVTQMPELDDGLERRRLTPFTPLIAFDSNNICGQRVVLSSGSWSAMMQTITQLILRKLDLTSAIVEPRIALGDDLLDLLLNDLDPRVEKLPATIREYLKKENFKLKLLHVPLVVNGVSKKKDDLLSHSDIGGGGLAARLDQNANTEKNQSSIS